MNESLGVIISFSTNELCFLDALLSQTSLISDDIVVSYGDKFFNGDDQDLTFLKEYATKYPKIKWTKYNVDVNLNVNLRQGVIKRPMAYFHNLSRYYAIQQLKNTSKWVLIIDADEIPEGNKFNQLYKSLHKKTDNCYKIACFWYFKELKYQARTYEDSPLIIEKKYLTKKNIFTDEERDGIYQDIKQSCHRDIRNIDNLPVMHHFSFIRKNKKDLLKKLQNWGHIDDIFNGIDPQNFVNFIYCDDNVNDVIHKYDYNIVENIFQIQVFD